MWQELGIAATQDEAAIRRAYAARLKQTRPDDDPAGFARLRAAYEAAIALARRASVTLGGTGEPPQAPAAPRPPAETARPAAPTSPSLHEIRFAQAFQRRDVAAAADALEAALRDGLLPIEAEMRLSAAMLELLIKQPNIPLALLTSTAYRFGWAGGDQPPANAAVQVLGARIAAEQWFANLQQKARSFSGVLGFPDAGAAKLLLGRGGFVFSRLLPPQPALLRLAMELQAHRPFLTGRFDAARMRAVERLVGGIFARAQAQAGYDRQPRWGNPFSRSNLILSLVAAPPTIATGFVFQGFDAAPWAWIILRVFLAHMPQWQRPFALFATPLSAAILALLTAFPNLADFNYGGSLAIPTDWRRWQPVVAQHYTPPPALLAAARGGDIASMRRLGQAICRVANTGEEMERGAAWLTAAADQGSLPAMFDLDRIYLNADGLLFDALKAYTWSGIALRISGTNNDRFMAQLDHTRATEVLYPGHRPHLDKLIGSWRPHADTLPVE